MRKIISFIAAFAAASLAPGLAAAPAPRLAVASLDQLPKPLPFPYDERANADRTVAAARARAVKSGKLLLIDFGGNWCLDCRLLAGIMDLKDMKAFIDRHYEVAKVDIGRMDRNQQIPAHYGIHRLEGVPAVLVIDPKSDRPLNRDHIFALADARSMTPQSLADWLAQWTR
jgi:thiol-disulfide isomerase/thioredoxin